MDLGTSIKSGKWNLALSASAGKSRSRARLKYLQPVAPRAMLFSAQQLQMAGSASHSSRMRENATQMDTTLLLPGSAITQSQTPWHVLRIRTQVVHRASRKGATGPASRKVVKIFGHRAGAHQRNIVLAAQMIQQSATQVLLATSAPLVQPKIR